jgi:hypothetical protein
LPHYIKKTKLTESHNDPLAEVNTSRTN